MPRRAATATRSPTQRFHHLNIMRGSGGRRLAQLGMLLVGFMLQVGVIVMGEICRCCRCSSTYCYGLIKQMCPGTAAAMPAQAP